MQAQHLGHTGRCFQAESCFPPASVALPTSVPPPEWELDRVQMDWNIPLPSSREGGQRNFSTHLDKEHNVCISIQFFDLICCLPPKPQLIPNRPQIRMSSYCQTWALSQSHFILKCLELLQQTESPNTICVINILGIIFLTFSYMTYICSHIHCEPGLKMYNSQRLLAIL